MGLKFVMLPPQNELYRRWGQRLAKSLPDYLIAVAENEQQAMDEIVDADAAFGTVTLPLLQKATRLRWIQSPLAAPPAGYYYPELVDHKLVVTNFREIFNDHIGAHVMSLVLAFSRGLHRYIPLQLQRKWQPAPDRVKNTVYLPEASMLIVGVGGIGAETARMAATFGLRVIGVDKRRKDIPEGMSALHPAEALDELLPEADFVVLTVPDTPVTKGYFNRERFRRMKPTAFFINIGRGKTTRLDDLVAALQAGEIAGAGLDVFEQEPLPADHPLWVMPGVILTPHVAAHGPYLDDRRFEILQDNCRHFAAGEPFRNVVDKKLWY